MEADQNQEVPAVQAVEAEPPAPEQPKSEEVIETPSPQDPPEPEEQPVEAAVTSENAPEKASAHDKAEPPKESENVAAEQVPEQAVEMEKCIEIPAQAEEKPEKEVVEQQVAETAAPEKKPETDEKPAEQKVEPVEVAAPEPVAAAAPEPAATNEVQAEPAKEAEPEKPTEAPQVQAEPPKEVETQPKKAALPLFYGWFLLSDVEERIKCSTMDFLKTLDTLEAFKKYISDFTGDPDKEVDLEQYYQTQGPLHCTTKYCDYGKVEGSKEYSEQQVVKDSYDTSTELSVTGLIVTPRTFGACVALTAEQLSLWPADEGLPGADPSDAKALEVGSKAHVTLGCAPNVEAVQTGLDLLEILELLKGDKGEAVKEELELGTLSYLSQGRWYLALREAVTCDATFSSFSEEERPAEPSKKEGGEKKKKPKCSIL